MVRPLLFAETPRAGRWNHRFLVPNELSMSEEQLAENAARARQRAQGADYLAVVRQVEQQDGGRMADELLVLHGVNVEHLDAATRRVLVKRLEERLDDLEHLVEIIDWEQEGKRLVVHRQELSQWFDEDFAAELAACRGPAPLESPEPEQPATKSRARLMFPLIGCLFILGAIILWRPWDPPAPVENEPPGPGASVGGSHVEALGAAELREMEPALRRLADQWKLPQRRDAFPKLCQAIVNKLERDFAMQPLGNEAGVSVEQRLAELVHSLAFDLLRNAGEGSLKTHLSDPGFQQRLMSVYTNSELDFAAPLRRLVASNDYDRQQHLRALQALCPGRTKQQVASVRELIRQAREMTLQAAAADDLSGDTDMVRRLHDAARLSATLRWPVDAGATVTPIALLNERDAAEAAVLLEWLSRAGFSDLSGVSEEATLAAARRFVQDKRDFLEVLSTQDPPGKRRYAILCARILTSPPLREVGRR